MYQCIENLKTGDSVQFKNKTHRVQNDKGWLFIQVTVNRRRLKIDAKKGLFNYGSLQDWVFNGWFLRYPSYEVFKSFAESELACFPLTWDYENIEEGV